MLDKGFLVVVVLNATGLFRFVAPQFGVEIGAVSVVLLLVNICYLSARQELLSFILRHPGVKPWVFLFLVWPLVTVFYAPSLSYRDIGLQLYAVTLVCAVAVCSVHNGLVVVHRALAASAIVTLIGILLSLISPDYFEHVARLAESGIEYHDRAFGFFMQPNSAANGIVLLFIGWYSMWNRKNTVWDVAAQLVFLGTLVVTGSRIGIVVGCGVCGIILFDSWRSGRAQVGTRQVKVVLMVASLVASAVALKEYSSANRDFTGGLIDRIAILTEFKLSEQGIRNDASLNGRLATQRVYGQLISQRPFFGYGLGAESYFLETRKIRLSAHSTLYSTAFQYGVFYPIVFALLLVQLYRSKGRLHLDAGFGTNSVVQFVVTSALLFCVTGDLLANRGFLVVVGSFIAAVYFPRQCVDVRRHPSARRGSRPTDATVPARLAT